MPNKTLLSTPAFILGGVILGALCGYFLPGVSLALDFVGRLFLGALKLLVIPLIAAGVVTGLSAFGEVRKAGRSGLKVAGYFLATTAVAVVVAIVVGLIINVGPISNMTSAVGHPTLGWGTLSDVLAGLLPGNLLQTVVEGKYFGIVLLWLLVGGVLLTMKTRARSVVSFFKGFHEALIKLVNVLLYAAPFGAFALVGSAVARNRATFSAWDLAPLSYVLAVVVALAFHFLVILPAALWLFGRRSPLEFYRQISPALLTGFATSSSIAAFPVTWNAVHDRSGLDNRAGSLVLPLGSVVNLDGTAIGIVIAGMFALQSFGLPVGLEQIVLLAILAVVMSIGAAGIPAATLLAAPVLFSTLGLTAGQAMAASAVLVGFDWLVDRLRAVVNVAGDAVGASVIAESFELKTVRGRTREKKGRPPERERTGRSRDRRGGRQDKPAARGGETGRDSGRGRRRTPVRKSAPQKERRDKSQPPKGRGPSPFEMKASGQPVFDREEPTREQPAAEPSSDKRTDSTRRPERRRQKPESAGRSRDRRAPSRDDRTPARPGPERRAEKPREEKAKPTEEPEGGRLKPAVVARELARVSAQLRDEGEEDKGREPAEKTEEKAVSAAPESRKEKGRSTAPAEEPPEARPAIDLDADDIEDELYTPESAEERPEVEKTRAIDDELEGDEEAEADETEVAYGRSRNYRGAALKKEQEQSKGDTPDPEKEETPPESFSADKASFGRTKKKRVR